MRITIVLVVLLAIAVPIQACNSGGNAPSRTNAIASYGPGSQSGTAPATTSFQWYTRLADAQAAARSQGKLILATSTKPGCGLCEKFKNSVVPQVASETARVAVGYVYDIRQPEVLAVDQALRANLKNATLMPLVGFLTPELGWVHGFWGSTSPEKFLGDIATAQRIYPVSSAAVKRGNAPHDRAVLTAVVNEYGETEWSLPGDVWPAGAPAPEDAIEGAPRLDAPATTLPDGAVLADATPAPASDEWSAPPAPTPAPAPEPVVIDELEPVPAAAEAPNPPFHQPPAAGAELEGWAEKALQAALRQIEEGDYARARKMLTEVEQRLPGSVLAREAARGSVAIYNHERIQGTSGIEQDHLRKRAARDLGGSMWGPLFS